MKQSNSPCTDWALCKLGVPDLLGTEEKEEPEGEGRHSLPRVVGCKAHKTLLWLRGKGQDLVLASENLTSNLGSDAKQPGPQVSHSASLGPVSIARNEDDNRPLIGLAVYMKRALPNATKYPLKLWDTHHLWPQVSLFTLLWNRSDISHPLGDTAGPCLHTAFRPSVAAPVQASTKPLCIHWSHCKCVIAGSDFLPLWLPACQAVALAALPLAALDLPSASLGLTLLVCPSRVALHAHIKGQLLDVLMSEQLEKASEADFPFFSY